MCIKMNTILEDIAAVIGFSATIKLAAWFGDGVQTLYVPVRVQGGQLLPKIIGEGAAKLLTAEFGGKHLSIPGIFHYEIEARKRAIFRLAPKGVSHREIAALIGITERRVQQIATELISDGLLDPPVAVAESEPPVVDTAMRAMVAVAVAPAAAPRRARKPAQPCHMPVASQPAAQAVTDHDTGPGFASGLADPSHPPVQAPGARGDDLSDLLGV